MDVLRRIGRLVARCWSGASVPERWATALLAMGLLGGLGWSWRPRTSALRNAAEPANTLDNKRASPDESVDIGDCRAMRSSQAAYSESNGGAFGYLACLGNPVLCGFPAGTAAFLDSGIASLSTKGGYVRSFMAGPPGNGRPDLGIKTYVYVATPAVSGPGSGRGCAVDHTGLICYTSDGTVPPIVTGALDRSCSVGTLEAGDYWLQPPVCLTHPVNPAKVTAPPAILRELAERPLITWCVDRLTLDSQRLVIHSRRELFEVSPIELEYGSDQGNPNMYLRDDRGRRYDSLETGGAAREGGTLRPGGPLTGTFTFPAPQPDATSLVFHDDDDHLRLENLRPEPRFRVQAAPQAELRKLLASAQQVVISDSWIGLPPASPKRVVYEFRRQGGRWQCDASVQVAHRQWQGAVAADERILAKALDLLADSPLAAAQYVPRTEHTDDYPELSFSMTSPQGAVVFHSESQGEGHVPWAAEWGGRAFSVPSDTPARALRLFHESAGATPAAIREKLERKARGFTSESIRAAQAALESGDYDGVLGHGQTALREDPTDTDAKELVEAALNGQRAKAQFDAAEAAMGANDLGKARAAAEVGRQLVPYDARGIALGSRILRLSQAERDLSIGRYDAAISEYDRMLEVDPRDELAGAGKARAVRARSESWAALRAVVEHPRPPLCAGKPFSVGKTEVRSGDRPAHLPGALGFEFQPDSPMADGSFGLQIVFLNDGMTPIPIGGLDVIYSRNGRRLSESLDMRVAPTEVAPGRPERLVTVGGACGTGTTSWAMEVTVHTGRGRSYSNRLEWK